MLWEQFLLGSEKELDWAKGKIELTVVETEASVPVAALDLEMAPQSSLASYSVVVILRSLSAPTEECRTLGETIHFGRRQLQKRDLAVSHLWIAFGAAGKMRTWVLQGPAGHTPL